MSGVEVVEREYRPFTARAIIWSIIMGFFILFAQGVMGRTAGYAWTGEAAAAMMAVTYAVFAVIGMRLRPEEYGVVYGMIETASCVLIPWGAYVGFLPEFAAARLSESYADFWAWMPSFMVPSDTAALRGLLEGGVLHIGAWIVPVLFIMAFTFCSFALGMFTILPMRKLYIEIERLPFPVATVGASVVEYTTKRQTNRLKWLWLGVLIGMIYGIWLDGMTIQSMFPDFPVIPIETSLHQYIQGPFPGGILSIDGITPDLIAWAYLIPLEVQVSTWITFFLAYVILASVQVRMKMIPYEPGGDYYDYMYAAAYGPGGIGFLHWAAGIYLAIGLVPFILNYRYIMDTLRRAMSGPTSEEREELAMPYRYSWAGFAIFYILTWIFLSATGCNPVVGFVMLLWNVILWHGYMRTIALGDWVASLGYATRASMNFMFVNTGIIGKETRANYNIGAGNTLLAGTDVGTTYTGETFRFAYLSGMKPRDMFKTQLFGLIFSLVLGMGVVLGFSKVFGANHELFAFNAYNGLFARLGYRQMAGGFNNWSGGRYFGGVLFGLVYGGLRVIFPWTPVSLVGIFFGLRLPYYALLYFFTSIAKYATLRIGGTRGYENVALPFMAGFATSGILATVYAAINNVFAAFGVTVAGIRGEVVSGAILIIITVVGALWALVKAWTAPKPEE